MKRVIVSALLIFTASALFGCGEKAGSVNETEVQQEDIIPDDVPEWEILEPKPTDYEREIASTEEFQYEITDGSAVIIKYTGSSPHVDIPAELGGVPVAEIGFYAFEAKYEIQSVTLPDTVTLIGEGAFMDCTSLESINIPESVTGIERGAFVDCLSLTEMTIPANVVFIQEETFTACEGLTTLTINNPELAYESWGIEELPDLKIIAPEGSAVAQWAADMGKL